MQDNILNLAVFTVVKEIDRSISRENYREIYTLNVSLLLCSLTLFAPAERSTPSHACKLSTKYLKLLICILFGEKMRLARKIENERIKAITQL